MRMSMCISTSISSLIFHGTGCTDTSQSGPKNPSGNFVLFKNTKTFVRSDLFAFLQFGRHGSQNQLFDEMQCGKWQAAAGLTRTKCKQNKRHILSASIAQAFVIELGENKLKLRELYSKQKQSCSHHSYGPTVNQLLLGASQMFKAIWDRSEQQDFLAL